MAEKTILAKVHDIVTRKAAKMKATKTPAKKKGRRLKRLKKGEQRMITMGFCPKIYDLMSWWCKSTGQYITTFIRTAVTNEFMRNMDERDLQIKKMEKYYADYFEDCTEKEALEAEKEAKELEKTK